MWIEFLLLGLIGEHVRGYYSGKGKSGGGKFIGGSMGSKEKANEYSDLRKAAAGGDADAKKKMESMRDKANQERLSGVSAKPSGGAGGASLTANAKGLVKKIDEVENHPSWNKFYGDALNKPGGVENAVANGERLYNEILKPNRGNAESTYRALQARRERISKEMMKVVDQYEAATAKTRKANDRRAERAATKERKNRSADNPYGLSGDGRSGSEARWKIKEMQKADQRLQDRINRMQAQMQGLDAISTKLKENFRLDV